MKKFFKIIFEILVYGAIVVAVVWGLPKGLSRMLNTPYPMATVTSGSMWPELKRGDLILIQGISKEQLAVGDIVVWRNSEGFTIHRVAKLGDKTFVTKGDANFREDDPVRYEDLVGRIYKIRGHNARLPYLGYIAIKVNTM